MTMFMSMILASLSVYFVDGWTDSFLDISLSAMLNLIVFIAVYMLSNRYFKNLKG